MLLHNEVPWVPDEQASVCRSCQAPFTTLKRRHHCRCCGNIFCATCSDHRIGGARACEACFLASVEHTVSDEEVEPANAAVESTLPEGAEQLQLLSIHANDTLSVVAPPSLWPPQPPAPGLNGGQTQQLVVAVWENQRCPASELSPRNSGMYSATALLPTEPGPWTDAEGQRLVSVHEDPPPPSGFAWAVDSSWAAQPFEYAWQFDNTTPTAPGSIKGTWETNPSTALGRKSWVRRRRWERAIVPIIQSSRGAIAPERAEIAHTTVDLAKHGDFNMQPLDLAPPPPSYESVVKTCTQLDAADLHMVAQQPFDDDLFQLVMSTPRRERDVVHAPQPEAEEGHMINNDAHAPQRESDSEERHIMDAGDGRPPPLRLQLLDPDVSCSDDLPHSGLTPGQSPCLATLYRTGLDPRPLTARDLRVRVYFWQCCIVCDPLCEPSGSRVSLYWNLRR